MIDKLITLKNEIKTLLEFALMIKHVSSRINYFNLDKQKIKLKIYLI